jgi:hypothetical protein
MATINSFDETHLEQICGVLADTSTGLSGSEIGSILQQLGIADENPTITKRKRLFYALANRQRMDGRANIVVKFIYAAMDPVRYTANREVFECRRHELNQILAFSGYVLGDDGKLRMQQAARTLDEAEQRADRLRVELFPRRFGGDQERR